MKKRKNPFSFLYSMRFAIGLLLVLCALCTVASLIPQERADQFYRQSYAPLAAELILTLGFNDAFGSWWFAVLATALCLNLFLCSVIKFPHIIRTGRTGFNPEKLLEHPDSYFVCDLPTTKTEVLFKKLGFAAVSRSGSVSYAVKNKFGLWGSWLCHVGMLVLIAGFSLGTVLSYSGSVYGVPGAVREVPSEQLKIAVDDFEVRLRDDFTVQQYVAALTVENTETGETKSGLSMVNHPFNAFGYKMYQNSVGWAADAVLLKDGEPLKTRTVYMGEAFELGVLPFTIVLHKFFPDFYLDPLTRQPVSLSPLLENPAAQFAVYHEKELMDVNFISMGHNITFGDYAVRVDNPRQYTLLQLRRDPTLPAVFVGGMLIILALVLAFYLQPVECAAVEENGLVHIYARSHKTQAAYMERVRLLAESIRQEH